MSNKEGVVVEGNDQKSTAGGLLDNEQLRENAKEDPLFQFLYKWRNHILIVAAVVAGGWFLNYRWEAAHVANMKDAAAVLRVVTNEWAALQRIESDLITSRKEFNATEEKEEKGKIQDRIKDLEKELSDTEKEFKGKVVVLSGLKEPYGDLGRSFEVLSAVSNKDYGKVQGFVDSFSISQGEGAEALGASRFYKELTSLLIARNLLDSNDHKDSGKALLQKLAEQGGVVAPSAALSFEAVASSEEEKSKASELKAAVAGRQPEQASLLE